MSKAALAIAAPMLDASFVSPSIIFPIIPFLILTFPPLPRIKAPDAVAVHCAVGVLWPPYSIGVLNCRSAAELWDVVTVAPTDISVFEISDERRNRASVQVEHAE